MIRAFIIVAITAFANAHQQELSEIYKAYKSSKKGLAQKVNYQSVSSPLSNDIKSRDKSLFFPPLAGQSPVDYHPQLRNLASNDSIVYYSWHAHVYFFHEDKNVTDRSLALRDQFMSKFSLAKCSDECFMGGPFDTCNQGIIFQHCFQSIKTCSFNYIYSQECACGILFMALTDLIPTVTH